MHEENDVSNRHMTWWQRPGGSEKTTDHTCGRREAVDERGAQPRRAVQETHDAERTKQVQTSANSSTQRFSREDLLSVRAAMPQQSDSNNKQQQLQPQQQGKQVQQGSQRQQQLQLQVLLHDLIWCMHAVRACAHGQHCDDGQ